MGKIVPLSFFLFLVNSIALAQVQLKTFTSGEMILKEDLNSNFIDINNYLINHYSHSPLFEIITSQEIKSEDINNSIQNINQSFEISLPSIEKGDLISAEFMNNLFTSLTNSINENLSFETCNEVKNKTTGFKKLDSDGILGEIPPSTNYCNYLYASNQINNFRIRTLSQSYNLGSGNNVRINETYLNQNTGRGWTLTILDKNLNKVFQQRYDTWNSATNTTNLINYMNNVNSIRAGLVIFTTADEPRINGAANANLRNAINNYAGCNVTTISNTPERGAYHCISMRNVLNEKQVLHQATSSSQTTSDIYINWLNFYNFVNKN